MTLACRKLKGAFERKITVSTNDPENKTQYLICKGKILEAAKLEPNRLNFGLIPRREPPKNKTVTLVRGDGGPLSPSLPEKLPPEVSATLRELEAGERYELEVGLKPPFKSERVRANLKVNTGVEQSPTAEIWVYGSITPRVMAQPNRITVPRNHPPDWSQTVRLVWEDDAPHKILGATVDDPRLKTKIVDGQDGQQTVVLEAQEANVTRTVRRSLVIKTDDSESPQVKVPVIISHRERNARVQRNPRQPSPVRTSSSPSKTKSKATTPKPPTKSTKTAGPTAPAKGPSPKPTPPTAGTSSSTGSAG